MLTVSQDNCYSDYLNCSYILYVYSCDDIITTYVCIDAAAKKTAKVMFDYEATQADELTIKVDDIVEVVSEEEPGWYV